MVVSLQPNAAAVPEHDASAGASTLSEKAAPSSWKRDVYVTGFGKFGDVLKNPTSDLAKKLAGHLKVTEARVLQVSIESCVEDMTEMYARAEESNRPCIFVHFGMSATSRSIALEKVGYNVANFRIPDEQGYVAKDTILCDGEPDEIITTLPLEGMLKTLQTVCPQIEISTDPGRYMCNFVYYHSLVWVKHQNAKGLLDHFALFVHVPDFRNVNGEVQLAVASKIVDIVADL